MTTCQVSTCPSNDIDPYMRMRILKENGHLSFKRMKIQRRSFCSTIILRRWNVNFFCGILYKQSTACMRNAHISHDVCSIVDGHDTIRCIISEVVWVQHFSAFYFVCFILSLPFRSRCLTTILKKQCVYWFPWVLSFNSCDCISHLHVHVHVHVTILQGHFSPAPSAIVQRLSLTRECVNRVSELLFIFRN